MSNVAAEALRREEDRRKLNEADFDGKEVGETLWERPIDGRKLR